jgi:MFS family permease
MDSRETRTGAVHDDQTRVVGERPVAERTVAHDHERVGHTDHTDHTDHTGLGLDRERQRDEFGGFNLGAAFFGWLVAIGLGVLLTALLSAAGAAIGITELSDSEAESGAETISIVGGALLLAVLAIAYYAGGYVAGRMSRFDGGRQGFGVWVMGIAITIVLAVLGAIAGAEYNVFNQFDLPRIPIDEGDLATGGIIALVAAVLLTLLAAVAGGKVGQRYHTRVDRTGLHRD